MHAYLMEKRCCYQGHFLRTAETSNIQRNVDLLFSVGRHIGVWKEGGGGWALCYLRQQLGFPPTSVETKFGGGGFREN
jgi:hypothetical protein